MGRERTPLIREHKGDVVISISDIFRNPDMQKEVIKECKKLKKVFKFKGKLFL